MLMMNVKVIGGDVSIAGLLQGTEFLFPHASGLLRVQGVSEVRKYYSQM